MPVLVLATAELRLPLWASQGGAGGGWHTPPAGSVVIVVVTVTLVIETLTGNGDGDGDGGGCLV